MNDLDLETKLDLVEIELMVIRGKLFEMEMKLNWLSKPLTEENK